MRHLDREVDPFIQPHVRVGLVFAGRLVPGVRTFVSLPAGFAGMPRIPFLLYSAAGTVIWTAALAYAGVVLKTNFTVVSDYIGIVTNVMLAGLAVMLVWSRSALLERSAEAVSLSSAICAAMSVSTKRGSMPPPMSGLMA